METALKQPKEGLGSVAETNRLLGGEYFASSGAQIKPFEAIQSSTLTEQPRLNIPTPPVSNTAGAISGLTSAYKDQGVAQTALEQKTLADAEKARETATESKSGLMSTVSEYLGIAGSRAQEEQKAGLSEKAQKVTQYTNQLEGLERAETNELRALDTRGLTDVQRAQNQREIQRRYAFEKADVALLQSAANRDYETASNIVNRKIDLALEPLKLKLDFQKMFYEENQDLLNEKEKRAFDLAIKNSDREYEDRKAVEKYKADITLKALENGRAIPSSTQNKLRNAETTDEVNQILAEDGISLAKAGAEIGEVSSYRQEREARIIGSIDELMSRANFQTVGIASVGKFLPGSLPRNFKADLETLKANISFSELQAMREASKTGGALGQVAIRELELLESTLGALDQGQSPANFRKNLQKVKESLTRWDIAVGGGSMSEEEQLRALGYTEDQIRQLKEAQ
jgi:hypothetical protein